MTYGLRHTLLATSLLALLTACGGGGDTNQSAPANSQQTANGSAHGMPSGPFAQADMQMSERIIAVPWRCRRS
jgi:hypothetical protein